MQEYCNGGNLKDSIAAGYFSVGNMPHRWSPMIAVMGSIVDGMEYMHSRRIIHGDLNPSNVLLKVRNQVIVFLWI
jgi:serine/threonine protein kinase